MYLRVVTVLFWVATSMGFMWQLCLLLKQYFQYRVSIQTTIITSDVIDNLDISVCVQSKVVLNYDKLYLNTGRKWTPENTFYKDLHNLTVAETMEYTLDGHDLLNKIFLPTRNTSVFEGATPEIMQPLPSFCIKHMSVTRYQSCPEM